MRRVVTLAFVLVTFVSLGCSNMNLARLRGASNTAAAGKKDCAACEKMCSVAGDSEKKPEAVQACKDDCQNSCE